MFGYGLRGDRSTWGNLVSQARALISTRKEASPFRVFSLGSGSLVRFRRRLWKRRITYLLFIGFPGRRLQRSWANGRRPQRLGAEREGDGDSGLPSFQWLRSEAEQGAWGSAYLPPGGPFLG